MVLIELGDGQTTTKITPQRTGVYTIKAGGRWDRDPRSRGRRGMDLRWDNGVIIARDEKAPNSEGVRPLGVGRYQDHHQHRPRPRLTMGPVPRRGGGARRLPDLRSALKLMSDHVSKPFLQMTYQGPMP
jgi:hypothetical protein